MSRCYQSEYSDTWDIGNKLNLDQETSLCNYMVLYCHTMFLGQDEAFFALCDIVVNSL